MALGVVLPRLISEEVLVLAFWFQASMTFPLPPQIQMDELQL